MSVALSLEPQQFKAGIMMSQPYALRVYLLAVIKYEVNTHAKLQIVFKNLSDSRVGTYREITFMFLYDVMK
jgi:hypothetical protein